MTFEEWEKKHKPVAEAIDGDGIKFGTTGKDAKRLKRTSPKKIWTLIKMDGGREIIVPGFRENRRLCHFITKNPWYNRMIVIEMKSDNSDAE